MVKLLKRETKQLQADKVKKQGDPKQSNNSDEDNPPWERRKLETRLAEYDKIIREKNVHIEQLLRDCRKMEQENQQCNNEIHINLLNSLMNVPNNFNWILGYSYLRNS